MADSRWSRQMPRVVGGVVVILLALSLAWLAGPLISPQVQGRPVVLARSTWAAGHYLAAADGWLRESAGQSERLVQALGPLRGMNWPAPAGAWPDSLYAQANQARSASAYLVNLQRAARVYAVTSELLPAHEQVVAGLDAAVVFADAVLGYLGAPDEAWLPELTALWQAASRQRVTAQTILDRQRAALGWELGPPGLAEPTTPAERTSEPGLLATHTPLVQPERTPGLFATHTPLVQPERTPAVAATPTPLVQPARTPAAGQSPTPVPASPSASPTGATPEPTAGLFARHTPVRP